MKLTEYKNESGEIEYKTESGTVIPKEVLEEWKRISIELKDTANLDRIIQDLLILKEQYENK